MRTTAPRLAHGEMLSARWKIEGLLGQGGMGAVYAAHDVKLERKVAVKILHPNRAEPDSVQRFEREAQVMARLDHPNVVSLFAFASHKDTPYIVMRYLEGASLSAVVRENGGRLSWEQFHPLLRQWCAALGYLHAQGVVHRDLKLSNVFVGYDGWLTLLDLGLARGYRSNLTRTGLVWGTPEFMSPEQITGEKVLDGRADLYALAGASYQALTGRPPFEQQEDQHLFRQHLEAPRPDVRAHAPQLPAALSAVLQKGMSVEPEDRFQTAAEFLEAAEAAFRARPHDENRTTQRLARPVAPRAPRPEASTLKSPAGLERPARKPRPGRSLSKASTVLKKR